MILNSDDKRAFVEFLCNSKFELIPGYLHDSPQAPRYTSPAQFPLESAASAFLVRADYEQWPLDLQPSNGKYVIMPRNGGPSISVSWPWEGTLDGNHIIREGSVSHYPSYWNTALQIYVPAQPPLKKAFREIAAYFRKTASTAMPVVRQSDDEYHPVWVGPGAASEWRNGSIRLMSYGPSADLELVDSQ